MDFLLIIFAIWLTIQTVYTVVIWNKTISEQHLLILSAAWSVIAFVTVAASTMMFFIGSKIIAGGLAIVGLIAVIVASKINRFPNDKCCG